MSEHTSIPQLSSTTQLTQEWLNDLAERPPFEDPRQAYSLLRAVLHALRDRLTAEEVAHFGAQLPMLVRGFYFEGWRPILAPNDYQTADQFYGQVRASLGGGRAATGIEIPLATRTILDFLSERIDSGEIRHVVDQLPEEIAALFPETAGTT